MHIEQTQNQSETIARTYRLLPQHVEWLNSRRNNGGTREPASAVLRELIAKAMAEDAQQAEEKSKAN